MPSKLGTFGTEKWPIATMTWSNSSSWLVCSFRSVERTVNLPLASQYLTSLTAVLNRMYLRTSDFSARPRM